VDEAEARIAGLHRALVARVEGTDELERFLADTSRTWEALVVGPRMGDPLAAAGRVKARDPDLPIVVLVAPVDLGRVQHAVLLAPFPGEPVRVVPLDAHAEETLDRHLTRARLRRKHQQAVRAANQALASAHPPPPRLAPGILQVVDAAPLPLLVVAEPGARVLHRNAAARALAPGPAAGLAEALPFASGAQVDRLRSGETLRLAAGGGRHLDASAVPLPDIGLLVVLVDATNLVAAEEERARQAALHETLLAALDDAGEGILLVERDRVVFANGAVARICGRSPDEVARTPLSVLAPPGDDASDAYETTVQAPDGRVVHLEVTVRPVPGRSASVVVLRDVTERRRVLADLQESRAALAQMDKLASMGSLVGGLAHEVRTPLTSTMNHLSLMRLKLEGARQSGDASGLLDGSLEESLAGAEAGVDRIRGLVRDLRSFLRGEAPRKQRTRVEQCVREAVRLFEAAERGHGVGLALDLGETAPVEADPTQVQQIVINLLQNAADASPPQGIVRVWTRDEGGEVVLGVDDEGPGIAPDVQERMWEPFVTTKEKGTGLGLTIVRRLAQLHDARIEVASAPGRGARFLVRFPRAP